VRVVPRRVARFVYALGGTNAFQAKWTEEIHAEWMRSVLENRPDLNTGQLQRTKDLMNLHAQDALVTGYESLISTLTLPDANDRHVLAAAIHAGAEVICTFNLRDFPASVISPYGIEAREPDDFLSFLYDADAVTFFQATELQRRGLKHPPKSQEEFWATLEAQRLPETVKRLRQHQTTEDIA
jgi:hypothetical protein